MLEKSHQLADMMNHMADSPGFEFEDIIVALELQVAALLVKHGGKQGFPSGINIFISQTSAMAEKLIEKGSFDFNDIDLKELD